MAIKQATARPPALSQEFVQDSEGEESEKSNNSTSEAIGVVQKNKHSANKSVSNGTIVAPAQAQESKAASDSESSGSSQASSSSEKGSDESDGGQSTTSDGSRKRSRPTEISQPSKKQKKR